MKLIHRPLAALTATAVASGLTAVAAPGMPGAAAEPFEPAEIALAWQGTALTTVPFSPAQAMYLSFTSTAVDRAVRKSLNTASSSETAAVARAGPRRPGRVLPRVGWHPRRQARREPGGRP